MVHIKEMDNVYVYMCAVWMSLGYESIFPFVHVHFTIKVHAIFYKSEHKIIKFLTSQKFTVTLFSKNRFKTIVS